GGGAAAAVAVAAGVDRQFGVRGQAHHLGVAGTGGHHWIAVLVAAHLHIDEGGAEHCQADNGSLAADYMADWFARVLGGQVA
ncbi:MAG: hypothetical protein RJA29_1216, partial [Pseudomonadota bacterium]